MKKTIISLVAIATLAVGLHAQTPAPAEKNWKDQQEFAIYTDIVKPDATPAARLQNLDKWKSGYPQSEFADTRLKIYLITYQALNNHRAAFDTATEILKTDPNDEASIREILAFINTLIPQQANAALSAQNKADLEVTEKVARALLANPDAVYGADKKPQGVADDAWAKIKPTMVNFAQFRLGYIGSTEKDPAKAETELTKTLQMDPNNAQASYMLAGVFVAPAQQKEHPEKMPLALFEYARAASYDGPGALDANTRKTIDGFLARAYAAYHGSPQGLDQLKTLAKASATPPADFKIKSIVDIAKEDEEKRQAAAKENPMLAFWNDVKERVTAAEGSAEYWEAMKGTLFPPSSSVPSGKFKGKLISATPETRPKELILALEKPDVADIKIVLDEPLPGKMDPGGDISFSGTPEELSKSPYMITFKVDKDDIEGWTGKGPAGAPRPAGKKAAPKKE